MRRRDDAPHRLSVVREVVLAERVQHAGEALRRQGLYVGGDVARDPAAEVGDSRAHPFIAPAVIPRISWRRSSRKKTITGTV